MYLNIKETVGFKGSNKPEDVVKIKALLNRHSKSCGYPTLSINASVNKKMIYNIKQFEMIVLSRNKPFGIIKPLSLFLTRLNDPPIPVEYKSSIFEIKIPKNTKKIEKLKKNINWQINEIKKQRLVASIIKGRILSYSENNPWLKIALEELGVEEISDIIDDSPILEDNKKKIIRFVHNPRVIEYHSATSLKSKLDETAWCSSFVNWTLKQVGIKGTENAQAISWLNWKGGIFLIEPAFGSIAVIDKHNGKGHVGFVVGKCSGKNNIIILGGNQGNRVSLMEKSQSKIEKFVFPIYKDYSKSQIQSDFKPDYNLPIINVHLSSKVPDR